MLYIYEHIFTWNKYLIHRTIGLDTIVGKHRGQTFVVVFQQVRTDFGRDFGPLLFADPLQILKVPRLSFGNSKLQLRPPIFDGI